MLPQLEYTSDNINWPQLTLRKLVHFTHTHIVRLGPWDETSAQRLQFFPDASVIMSELNVVGVTTKLTDSMPWTTYSEFPHLTTTFTYAEHCGRQWVQWYPQDIYKYWNYYSVASAGHYFLDCQPDQRTLFYPGICPSGLSIATVTEYRSTTGDSERLWGGILLRSVSVRILANISVVSLQVL